ncbi:MAG: histidine triad nucleotide-binding protein [Oligoflexia bacterium]|nr:histidine triad nucleotide-binding protein [Oligoflexia bacterium]
MEDCIFCKIIKKEISSDIVFEDNNLIAFRDINPQTEQHILIVPKKHIANVTDLGSDDTLNKIYNATKQIAKEQGFLDSGYRVVVNYGRHACQTVFHVHFHLMGGEQMSGRMG